MSQENKKVSLKEIKSPMSKRIAIEEIKNTLLGRKSKRVLN